MKDSNRVVSDAKRFLQQQLGRVKNRRSCSTSTTRPRSPTRAHIEATGAKIVLNVGDQFSDLEGGYALHPTKLPNPMYYLP
ncbi:hypothetical protein OG738_02700 [Amycolatopsis sp. NBC_01488]|nr:HAD family acid phosphatase [Amycolatopsis sp. NBC_01488]